ncbi:MAG: hypothetical protein EZS28_020850 [Streblomastix strix]|uniref:Uncharacterized protein n=1 Tax=Streblomastix strix TaxID=222440 RepID=A0A5J4VM95_9EUKA|nr:MAG: hypothetical protein EZS28_020850 [Streblomastix strix]
MRMGPVKNKKSFVCDMSEVEHPSSSLISMGNSNSTNDELKASQDSTAVTQKPSQRQITEKPTLPEINAPLPSLNIHFSSINDEHMNDAGFEIWYDPGNRDVYISDEGTPVARVTTQGIMDITSGAQQPYEDWGFESKYEMEAWAAQIIAEIATIKAMQQKTLQKQESILSTANNNKPQTNVDQITQAYTQKIKHSRDEENAPTITPVQTPEPSFTNLQQQFEQSSKRYAYYDSDADEKVSIKVGKLLEGVFQKSAQDFDPLGFKLDPLDRNALFDKVKLKKVEKHWKLPDVKESAKGEKSVQFHRAVESSAAVQEGLYKSIRHIASGNTGNLFGELLEIFQASAVATGDAQSVREGQLDGIQQRTSQEEILSETSKKRFANINKVQKEVFQGPRSRNRNFGLGRGKWSRRGRFSNNKWNSKPSKYPNLRNQEYDYQEGRNASKNTKRFSNRFQKKEE